MEASFGEGTRVTIAMRWNLIMAGLAALVLLLLLLAWMRGGPEQMRTISQPVEVPELAG